MPKLIRDRWTHEYVPLAARSGIVGMPKLSLKTPEVDADAEETQPEFIR